MKNLHKLIIDLLLSVIQLFPIKWTNALLTRVLIWIKYRKQVTYNNLRISNLYKKYEGDLEDFYINTIRNISRIITESVYNVTPVREVQVTYNNINSVSEKCIATDGLILIASHYGNWELVCSLIAKQTDLPVFGVYKPLKNQALDEWLLAKRSKQGLRLVPMNKIGRVVVNNVRKKIPAIYILIADQNPSAKNSIIWSEFLGVESAFFNGPAKLRAKYDFGIMYMKITPKRFLFEYDVDFVDIDCESEESIISDYSRNLVRQIVGKPEHWLWSHRRWKRNANHY